MSKKIFFTVFFGGRLILNRTDRTIEQNLKSISYNVFLFYGVPSCSTMFYCSIVLRGIFAFQTL